MIEGVDVGLPLPFDAGSHGYDCEYTCRDHEAWDSHREYFIFLPLYLRLCKTRSVSLHVSAGFSTIWSCMVRNEWTGITPVVPYLVCKDRYGAYILRHLESIKRDEYLGVRVHYQ